jgi:hypothetical protein
MLRCRSGKLAKGLDEFSTAIHDGSCHHRDLSGRLYNFAAHLSNQATRLSTFWSSRPTTQFERSNAIGVDGRLDLLYAR